MLISGKSRAESVTTVPIFNDGTVIPDSSISIYAPMYCVTEMGEEIWFVCVSRVLIPGTLSSLVGSSSVNLTVYTRSDFISESPFRESEIDYLYFLGSCIIVPSSASVVPSIIAYTNSYSTEVSLSDYWGDFLNGTVFINNFTKLSLLSGYDMNVKMNGWGEQAADTATAVFSLRAFSGGISINGADSSSSDVAEAGSIFNMPPPPDVPQTGFMNVEDAGWFGNYVKNVLPASLLVPLISFISFTLVMSLLAILKHA